MTPSWLYYLFAVAMLVVAAYAATFLVIAIRSRRSTGSDVEISHFVMGLAMAGMFESSWAFGPSTLWEVLFGILLVWFMVGAIRSVAAYGLHVPHAGVHGVMSLAMLLMYWFPMGAGASSMSMSMSSSGGGAHIDPGLAFVLALLLFGSAIFTLASPQKGGSIYGTHVALETIGPGVLEEGNAADDAYLVGSPSAAGGLEGLVATPWLLDAAHVVMCVAMGFMLILML